jgi:hypothetical protein
MWNIFAYGMKKAKENHVLLEAFDILVKRYFEEYEDAVDVHGEYRSALKTIFKLTIDDYDENDGSFDEFFDCIVANSRMGGRES